MSVPRPARPSLRTALLAAGVFLTLSGTAFAQSDAEGCTAIADDQLRLACYDAAFGLTPGQAPDMPEGAPVEVTLASEQLIPARPSGRDRATVVIACVDGETRLSFSFAGQLVSEGAAGGSVSLRIDQQPTQTLLLPPSDDLTSLGFARSADAERFLRQTLAADSLFVRTTPPRQRTISVNFDLRQMAELLAPVREACGW